MAEEKKDQADQAAVDVARTPAAKGSLERRAATSVGAPRAPHPAARKGAPPQGAWGGGGREMLARAAALGTLEAAYGAWEEARSQLEECRRELESERRRLEEQGAFLLGTVRAAQRLDGGGPPATGTELTSEDALRHYVREAEARLVEARESLEQQGREQCLQLEEALAAAQARVESDIARYQALAPPRVRLWLRPLGGGRTILHLERPSDDAAVLLLEVLTGQVASRHGFLRDEVTEELSQEPPILYAETGVPPEATRASAFDLERLLADPARKVLPARGILPFLVPRPEGGADLVLFRCRGPVLELERAEGEGFRSVLSREEGEQVAGHLLRLQLLGRLALDLSPG